MIPLALAVILRILSNPIGNVFQKKLSSRGTSPLTVNFLTFFLLSIVCVLPALKTDWLSFSNEFWINAIIGGVFGACGNCFLVLALRKGELSILGPINSYKSVVGLITAMILLHEMPSLTGIAGVALIILGSYFVFETTEEGFSWKLLRNREIVFRILAMVLCAIEAVFDKKVILYSDVTTSFIAWCWFGALFSLILMIPFKVSPIREISQLDGSSWLMFLILVLCVGTMQFTTNSVFARMNVGYGLALFQLSTLVSVILGWMLFKEKALGRKLLGSAVMIAGSTMVILG